FRTSNGCANKKKMPLPPRNPRYSGDPTLVDMAQRLSLLRFIGLGAIIFALVVGSSATSYVVEPGTRGIKVTLGRPADQFLPEGFGFKAPFITTIVPINVRQKTQGVTAQCFSSDLQQIVMDLRVLYRVPEQSVVEIYRKYAGDPFDSLIAP